MKRWSGADMRCPKCNKYLPDRCTCNGPSIEERRSMTSTLNSELNLDQLEALAREAEQMFTGMHWYTRFQILDGISNDESAAFIGAIDPDTVLELIALARRAAPNEPAQAFPELPELDDDPDDDPAFTTWRGENGIDIGDKWVAWSAWCAAIASLAQKDEQNQSECAPPFAAPASQLGAWVSVESALPEKYCLAAYANRAGRHRIIRAMYVRQYEIEATGDECDSETNDADDMEYIREGWYELIDNWGDYSSVKVCEGEVTHWMPLPPTPDQCQPAGAAKGGMRPNDPGSASLAQPGAQPAKEDAGSSPSTQRQGDADAARYRWLREANWSDIEGIYWSPTVQGGSTPEECLAALDAEIDKARSAHPADAPEGGIK